MFSLTKCIELAGRVEALKRVFRRSILLFAVGCLCVKKTARTLCQNSSAGLLRLRQLNNGFQTISSSIFPAISSGLIWYVPLFNWFTICWTFSVRISSGPEAAFCA